jgi:1-acyl-sn-glycerol-3-phosphate acyltransferase
MKAPDRRAMRPNWKHAPPAWRAATSPVADEPERLPAVYAALKRVLPPVLRRFFAFHVSGLEHVPEQGPFIVAANHANYLDGVVLATALPRKISFLVMPRVYRATPLHPYFHDHVGSIPVSLARPDPGAIRRALRVLEQGGVVGIFPEGPFSQYGQLVRGQPGVALVALRSGVPVVPAAISGTFQALASRRFFVPRRVPLAVRFGKPIRFTWPRQRATQGLRADVTGGIMEEIAALLAADESRASAAVPR